MTTEKGTNKDILALIRPRYLRESEVRRAAAAYPGMELGKAYRTWKNARGEKAEPPIPAETAAAHMSRLETMRRLRERPCTQKGCDGTQKLESVCAGCVEGQAGYKTKWTCATCMHRDLSKEDMNAWMIKLSSS